MSCAPYLVHDAEHNQRQPGPNKYNCLLTIVSNDGHIVLDIWIAIEKFVSPAPEENSGQQKDDHRDSECDAQRRNASLFNHRYHKGTVCIHGKTVSVRSILLYHASGGFSAATEGRVANPSSEGGLQGTEPQSLTMATAVPQRRQIPDRSRKLCRLQSSRSG